MGFMGQLYKHHSIVLLIVLLQIQLELFAVGGGHNLRPPQRYLMYFSLP